MWQIKFDIRERHNDVDLEAVSLCPFSRYDTNIHKLTVDSHIRTSICSGKNNFLETQKRQTPNS